jgi:hypothetical protein
MFGLIQANFIAARKHDRGPDAPSLFRDFGAFYFLGFERFDGSRQIVAHQVELGVDKFVTACVFVGGMHGDLGGR